MKTKLAVLGLFLISCALAQTPSLKRVMVTDTLFGSDTVKCNPCTNKSAVASLRYGGSGGKPFFHLKPLSDTLTDTIPTTRFVVARAADSAKKIAKDSARRAAGDTIQTAVILRPKTLLRNRVYMPANVYGFSMLTDTTGPSDSAVFNILDGNNSKKRVYEILHDGTVNIGVLDGDGYPTASISGDGAIRGLHDGGTYAYRLMPDGTALFGHETFSITPGAGGTSKPFYFDNRVLAGYDPQTEGHRILLDTSGRAMVESLQVQSNALNALLCTDENNYVTTRQDKCDSVLAYRVDSLRKDSSFYYVMGEDTTINMGDLPDRGKFVNYVFRTYGNSLTFNLTENGVKPLITVVKADPEAGGAFCLGCNTSLSIWDHGVSSNAFEFGDSIAAVVLAPIAVADMDFSNYAVVAKNFTSNYFLKKTDSTHFLRNYGAAVAAIFDTTRLAPKMDSSRYQWKYNALKATDSSDYQRKWNSVKTTDTSVFSRKYNTVLTSDTSVFARKYNQVTTADTGVFLRKYGGAVAAVFDTSGLARKYNTYTTSQLDTTMFLRKYGAAVAAVFDTSGLARKYNTILTSDTSVFARKYNTVTTTDSAAFMRKYPVERAIYFPITGTAANDTGVNAAMVWRAPFAGTIDSITTVCISGGTPTVTVMLKRGMIVSNALQDTDMVGAGTGKPGLTAHAVENAFPASWTTNTFRNLNTLRMYPQSVGTCTIGIEVILWMKPN